MNEIVGLPSFMRVAGTCALAICVAACAYGTASPSGPLASAAPTLQSLTETAVGPTASAQGSSEGISQARAVELAQAQAPEGAEFDTAVAGEFSEVYDEGTMGSVGPLKESLGAREVWLVEFQSQFLICPPDGSACLSPPPGLTTVVLDFYTGEWIHTSGYAPRP